MLVVLWLNDKKRSDDGMVGAAGNSCNARQALGNILAVEELANCVDEPDMAEYVVEAGRYMLAQQVPRYLEAYLLCDCSNGYQAMAADVQAKKTIYLQIFM